MPRRTRTSRLGMTLAMGVVAALPLLAAGPAAPAWAASPRVEFSRGVGLLSCDSKPSDRDLTVPAESRVIFVNKLRDDATLRIDGRDAARVQEDGSSEVLFHRGTVRVEMVPDCGLSLSSDVEAVSVTVVAPGGSASGPSSSGPARSSGSSPTGASPAQSSRGSHRAGTDGSASPDGSASASASEAPAGGGATSPDAGAGQGPAAGGDEGVAAEPVSTETGSGKNGPNGLLTIIAVGCIVGVSAGAIRAIAAQRATRTSVA
jgi:hypothetical protein